MQFLQVLSALLEKNCTTFYNKNLHDMVFTNDEVTESLRECSKGNGADALTDLINSQIANASSPHFNKMNKHIFSTRLYPDEKKYVGTWPLFEIW